MSDAEKSSESAWIINTSDERFEQDVVLRSQQVPVIVDFWADWCQPCRMLAPVLEKLTEQFQGQFVLVKANTDANQAAAANFRVQSIPAIYAVVQGEAVDFFAGVLPEDQLRSWLQRIVLYDALRKAGTLERSDPDAARSIYEQALADDAESAEAQIGLARLALQAGDLSKCQEIIERLEQRGFLEAEAEKVKAALDLQEAGATNLDELRRAAEADPENLEAQLNLAKSLAAAQDYQAALQIALSVVQRDKEVWREPARQLMVDIFHVLPDDSELASDFRRQLSMALY